MYDLMVKRTICTELEENYLDISCSVKLKNRTTSYIQINVTFHYDLIDPIIKITFYYRFTVYRKFLIDVSEDFCGLTKKGKPAPVINLIWKTLNEASNFAEGCPFSKGQNYYVKDYVFDVSQFPPAMPTGDYRIDIVVSNSLDKKDVVKAQIFAEIKRKPMADIKWN
ncbi:uncharacterized protein LOC129799260 [Phlebotomus papatasi]|uniref:uncharacterized protein LOC129799260 n=1 Tax=Phlebotomus papatasi TaxID=29031 RepID=UPI0024844E14|nr:uncharacterized protein LOC129799260 [Phlebotomus papatasi]